MKRLLQVSILVALAGVAVSCGGSSTLDNTAAPVVLSIEIEEYNPDISVCSPAEVTVETMTISSNSKDPTASLSSNQDVRLTRWQVTPYRTDGGTEVSPSWTYDLDVYVPAGGDTTLENYRVYPAEYLSLAPLSYLLPENGGFDPETGNRNIRQTMRVEIFGETVSGRGVSVVTNVAFNFGCF